MRVADKEGEVGRVALDDIGALIVSGVGATLSTELISRLAHRGVPIVTCDSSYNPVAWQWPCVGNSLQAKRMDAQIGLKTTTRKRLWRQIVVAKIDAQIVALSRFDIHSQRLIRLRDGVKTDDSGNAEALAAAHYWPQMMGDGFKRDRDASGVNAALNYGYAVLRSALARAVSGAGLHPTIGLHHKNQFNAFRLVDDLMEPFRPEVDSLVRESLSELDGELNPRMKATLAAVLERAVQVEGRSSSVSVAAQTLAKSLVDVCLGESAELTMPRLQGCADSAASG